MTTDDLELTVRLARWMGWTEAQDDRERHKLPAEVIAFATFGSPDTLMTYRVERGRRVGADWHPLTRADNAAEVMAEAVRRGWHLSFHIYPSGDTSIRILGSGVGSAGQLPLAHSLGTSWTRAVCLAVLAAAEGGA